MGTSNFHNENASQHYTISGDYEEAYTDTEQNIKYALLALDKENEIQFIYDNELELSSELISFPAHSIGTVYENINFLNLDIQVEIIPLMRAGYYEGANLDYEINFQLEGTEFEDIELLIEDIEDCPQDYGLNAGLVALHLSKLRNIIEDTENNLINITESVFSDYSECYEIVAQFSNGETIYQKVA